MVVAWSCKSRGFCPSCTGRRMAQTATNWLEHVLPATPLRQFVVTFPFELRQRLAYHGRALGAVGRIFMDSVLGWYRRRMRDQGIRDGRSGAVMVVQRSNADMKLNPHIHAIFVDGVFATVPDGKPVFHALPRLSTEEVGDLLQVVRARVLAHLVRRGIIEPGSELTVLDDGFAEREPALAQLAAAAVSGLPVPSGPRACPPCPCPTRLRRARRRREPRRTGRFASCAASPRRRPKCSTPSLAACHDAAELVLCQAACFIRCAAIHSGRNTVCRPFSSARFSCRQGQTAPAWDLPTRFSRSTPCFFRLRVPPASAQVLQSLSPIV
jgi:hypothetical protein